MQLSVTRCAESSLNVPSRPEGHQIQDRRHCGDDEGLPLCGSCQQLVTHLCTRCYRANKAWQVPLTSCVHSGQLDETCAWDAGGSAMPSLPSRNSALPRLPPRPARSTAPARTPSGRCPCLQSSELSCFKLYVWPSFMLLLVSSQPATLASGASMLPVICAELSSIGSYPRWSRPHSRQDAVTTAVVLDDHKAGVDACSCFVGDANAANGDASASSPSASQKRVTFSPSNDESSSQPAPAQAAAGPAPSSNPHTPPAPPQPLAHQNGPTNSHAVGNPHPR